jgi:hypothetical protein
MGLVPLVNGFTIPVAHAKCLTIAMMKLKIMLVDITVKISLC